MGIMATEEEGIVHSRYSGTGLVRGWHRSTSSSLGQSKGIFAGVCRGLAVWERGESLALAVGWRSGMVRARIYLLRL
jgi:hypothetical protein